MKYRKYHDRMLPRRPRLGGMPGGATGTLFTKKISPQVVRKTLVSMKAAADTRLWNCRSAASRFATEIPLLCDLFIATEVQNQLLGPREAQTTIRQQ